MVISQADIHAVAQEAQITTGQMVWRSMRAVLDTSIESEKPAIFQEIEKHSLQAGNQAYQKVIAVFA